MSDKAEGQKEVSGPDLYPAILVDSQDAKITQTLVFFTGAKDRWPYQIAPGKIAGGLGVKVIGPPDNLGSLGGDGSIFWGKLTFHATLC